MYKNKVLSLVVSLFIATFLMGSAPANKPDQDPPDPTPDKRAYIVNDQTGQLYELSVRTRWIRELENGVNEAVYYVEIPEAIFLGHSPRSVASRSYYPEGNMDPTRSVVV